MGSFERLHWFQFSLGSVLTVTTALSVICAICADDRSAFPIGILVFLAGWIVIACMLKIPQASPEEVEKEGGAKKGLKCKVKA